MSALVMPMDTDVLRAPPALSSSPLLGPDFLSELQCAPWRSDRSPPADVDVDSLAGQVARVALTLPRPILATPPAHKHRASHKKRVVFADDKGLALVQTRLVTEPSHAPPRWTVRVQASLLRVPNMPPPPPQPRWVLTSPQPVADYPRFCDRLERDNVALENLVSGPSQRTVSGVIKVKNLHFEKFVFVRATPDRWRSQRDWGAIYIAPPADWGATYICPPPGVAGAAAPLYDRFSFEMEVPEPSVSDRIEFCVGFRCPVGEFWDNNGGKNYVARRERPEDRDPAPENVYRAQVESWATVSTWAGINGDVPYW